MWEKNWSKLCLWASRRYDKQKNVKILVPCALIRMRQLWANFLWTNSMPKNDLRVWHHLVLFENLFLKKKVPQGTWGKRSVFMKSYGPCFLFSTRIFDLAGIYNEFQWYRYLIFSKMTLWSLKVAQNAQFSRKYMALVFCFWREFSTSRASIMNFIDISFS